MKLTRLFTRRPPEAGRAAELYDRAVAQARSPAFYTDLEVPDTLDGRFELVALHVYLILRRLHADHERTARLSQALFDRMFEDMDGSVRELGAGDLGVGPRVKKMARNFYGRIKAYDQGLAGDRGELQAALRRNLYGNLETVSDHAVAAMAAYLARESAALAERPLDEVAGGQVAFGPAPAPGSEPGAGPGAGARAAGKSR
jgi:cytochrome b pre-mRNA-processing protein 3